MQTELVSIGMPVYNGENYIAAAIDSIRQQSYANFELIICDNASTDKTEEICRVQAAADHRIRYHRNSTNLGAAPNFNLAVDLAKGDLFKWAAHDDIHRPDYLEVCVDALTQDETLVWAHTQCVDIDEGDREITVKRERIDLGSWQAHRRFADAIIVNHPCFSVFGVIRMAALRNTTLIGSFVASDRVLIAQLALQGRYFEAPRRSFLHRQHLQRSTVSEASMADRLQWFNPNTKMEWPNKVLLREYWKSIGRYTLPKRQRVMCYLHLARWLAQGGQSF